MLSVHMIFPDSTSRKQHLPVGGNVVVVVVVVVVVGDAVVVGHTRPVHVVPAP